MTATLTIRLPAALQRRLASDQRRLDCDASSVVRAILARPREPVTADEIEAAKLPMGVASYGKAKRKKAAKRARDGKNK